MKEPSGTHRRDRVHVKICGITRFEDACLAADLGASAIGFVFWPESPRFIDPYRARDLVRRLPPFLAPVGVFVDPDPEYLLGVAGLVKLAAVQLHGSLSDWPWTDLKTRVIRALPVTDGFTADLVKGLPPEVTVLLDAHDPIRIGGTGRTVDWEVAARVASARRLILSGGLRPENVTEAIDVVRPYAVDVSSGVEAAPGVKDPGRLRLFMEAVDAARRSLTSAKTDGR